MTYDKNSEGNIPVVCVLILLNQFSGIEGWRHFYAFDSNKICCNSMKSEGYQFPSDSRVELRAFNIRGRRFKYLDVSDVVRIRSNLTLPDVIVCQFNATRTYAHIRCTSRDAAQRFVAESNGSRIVLADGRTYRLNARVNTFKLAQEITVADVVSIFGKFIRAAIQPGFMISPASLRLEPNHLGYPVPLTEAFKPNSNVWVFLPICIIPLLLYRQSSALEEFKVDPTSPTGPTSECDVDEKVAISLTVDN